MQEVVPVGLANLLYETFVSEKVDKLDSIRTAQWIKQPLATNNGRYLLSGDRLGVGRIYIQEVSQHVRQIDLTPNRDYYRSQPLRSKEVGQYSLPSKILSCRGSNDGRLVAYRHQGSYNPLVVSIDKPDKPIQLAQLSRQGETLRWSINYSLIASSGNCLVLWNLEEKPTAQRFPESHGDDIRELEWLSPNEIVAGTNCGNIYIWDVRISKPIKRYSGGGVGSIQALATCKESFILSSDKSKDLRLWDTRKDKCFAYPRQPNEIRRLLTLTNAEGSVSFAAGSDCGTVTLWQENPLFVHLHHTSAVKDISFSQQLFLTAESNKPRLCFWRPNPHWQQH